MPKVTSGKKNHVERLNKNKIKLISAISFLLGFSQAVLIYVMSSYFEDVWGTENVGPFYFVAYMIALVLLLNLHKIVKKIGKSSVFCLASFSKIITLSFLVVLPPSKFSTVFMLLYIIAVSIEWTSLDAILESFSVDKVSGKIRGLHLTIFNAGFLAGPFLSTWILERFQFHGIFVFLYILGAIVMLFGIVGLRDATHAFNKKINVKSLLEKAWRRNDIARIYYVSFVLEVFFALMVIYTPLYLRDLGMSWEKIGYVFTVMLVPFVIVQYPAGVLADRKTGERKFLIFSLLLMSVSTLLVYGITSSNMLVWMAVLFLTRIGAALIEVLRDSYFYKRIDGRDVDLIDFFRTAMPMAYIIATGISSVLFLFFPLRTTFLLVALIVISAVYPACMLVEKQRKYAVRSNSKVEVEMV